MLRPGWWRAGPRAGRAYACPEDGSQSVGAVCVGGAEGNGSAAGSGASASSSHGADAYCRAGHTAPLCKACVADDQYYDAQTVSCQPCDGASGPIWESNVLQYGDPFVSVLGALLLLAWLLPLPLRLRLKRSRRLHAAPGAAAASSAEHVLRRGAGGSGGTNIAELKEEPPVVLCNGRLVLRPATLRWPGKVLLRLRSSLHRSGIVPKLKLVVGFYQVAASLPRVYNVVFPQEYRTAWSSWPSRWGRRWPPVHGLLWLGREAPLIGSEGSFDWVGRLL